MSIDEQNNSMYRSLFEGSQASLADMAARQAQALSRVGRLRQSLVTILRKNYGSLVNSAEMSMGKKLNDVDDEILLAYLESCVSASMRIDNDSALHLLREALGQAGIAVTGNDVLLWTDQVRTHVVATAANKARPSIGLPKEVDLATSAVEDTDTVSWEQDTATSAVSAPQNLEELFGEYSEPVLWDGPLGTTNEEPVWSPSPVKPSRETITNPIQSAVSPFDEPQEEHLQSDARDSGPAGVFEDETDDKLGVVAPTKIMHPVFKPEIIAQGAHTKRARKSKARVLSPGEPDENLYTQNQLLPVDLDEQVRSSLVAASSLARPVFTRDLISVAGSAEVVEAWEMECRLNSEETNIRFVAPKSRHRLRGRLIIAENPEEPKAGDWWGQATRKYRAGRLYELGVLLHRVGDEVVTYKLDDESATFHLNTPKGLVGVLIVLSSILEQDTPGYNTIRDCLVSMFSERLVILAVLTASGEKESLPNLVDFVKKQATDLNITPLMPVVAARSWEYSDDRGSSAVLLF